MPSNTTYNPTNTERFNKDCLKFKGGKIYLEAASGETIEADLTLTDDVLLTGGSLLVVNGSIKDQVYFQVVHPVYGVVDEFVDGWYINPDGAKQFDLMLNYPAKLFTGLKIRVKYIAHNSSLLSRVVAANLYIHKVLI